jgi:hypothetical protein
MRLYIGTHYPRVVIVLTRYTSARALLFASDELHEGGGGAERRLPHFLGCFDAKISSDTGSSGSSISRRCSRYIYLGSARRSLDQSLAEVVCCSCVGRLLAAMQHRFQSSLFEGCHKQLHGFKEAAFIEA